MIRIPKPTRFAALLLGLLIAGGLSAQETDDAAPIDAPNLVALQASWWSFFEGSKEEVEPRIDPFFDDVESQISNLQPQNEEIATTILVAVRDNISAYLALLDELELKLNRAAELATPPAKQLFLDSIQEMSLDDVQKIGRAHV